MRFFKNLRDMISGRRHREMRDLIAASQDAARLQCAQAIEAAAREASGQCRAQIDELKQQMAAVVSELGGLVKDSHENVRTALLSEISASTGETGRAIAALDERIDEIGRRLPSELRDFIRDSHEATRARVQDKFAHVQGSFEGRNVRRLHDLRQTVNLIARSAKPRGRDPIKCLFLVHFIQAWDALADIYAAMRASADFEPIVVSIRRRNPGAQSYYGEELVHAGLQKFGVEHIRLPMEDSFEALDVLKAIGPDVIFRQSPWDIDIQPAFSADELSFARLCYVPYFGLQVTDRHRPDETGPDLHADTPFHRACWKIFCENETVWKEHEDGAVLRGRNVIATGHPKLKYLERQAKAEGAWPIRRAETGAPRPSRLIWAPHHSIAGDWLNFGMFPEVHKDMLAWAREDRSTDFVLKPHPLLFEGIELSGDPAQIEGLRRFLAEWRALPNTAIEEGGDYPALFAASDLLITDGVSFLATYPIFGKPHIFIERPDHVPFNALGAAAADCAHRVSNVEQARQVVESLRNGAADARRAAREAFVENILPKGDPAEIILGLIREGFGMNESTAPNDDSAGFAVGSHFQRAWNHH